MLILRFVPSTENEYYVAFFNLSSNETHISIGIDTVIRRLMPSTKTKEVLHWMTPDASTSLPKRREMLADSGDLICKAFDVWNRRDLGVVDKRLGALVEGHGAVVFSVTCTGFL